MRWEQQRKRRNNDMQMEFPMSHLKWYREMGKIPVTCPWAAILRVEQHHNDSCRPRRMGVPVKSSNNNATEEIDHSLYHYHHNMESSTRTGTFFVRSEWEECGPYSWLYGFFNMRAHSCMHNMFQIRAGWKWAEDSLDLWSVPIYLWREIVPFRVP